MKILFLSILLLILLIIFPLKTLGALILISTGILSFVLLIIALIACILD